MMVLRVLAMVVAAPCILIGLIWILQGLNILPGSFMTGHIQWTVYGVLLGAVGIALTYWVTRPKR